jgi:hypothetical protein
VETCVALLRFGGMGHTAAIYSRDDARTREYALRVPAMRVLVNTPSTFGAIGITTNVFPSMTLGCGAVAGNSTSDNIGPRHLINIKRLAYVARRPEETFEMPLDYNAAPAADSSQAPISIDRATVVAAVERYLASRGVATQPAGATAPNAAAATGVAAVVDRFLASRGVARQSAGAAAPNAAPAAVSDVAAAVDRYLATRGVASQPAGTPATGAAAVIPNVAAAVVDRFLAHRSGSVPAPASAAPVATPVPQTGFG